MPALPNDPLSMHRKTVTFSRPAGSPNPPRQPEPQPTAPAPQAQPAAAPVALSLRTLEGKLMRTVTVPTAEVEDDPAEGDCFGQYVFRDEAGEKFMWGPRPFRYESHDVATVAEADHIMFMCPLCFAKNKGPVGTHGVLVTFAGRDVPDEAGSRDSTGKPSRWTASGTTIDDLVLTPSILLDASQPPEQGCHWHGFVGSSGVSAGHAR